MDEDPYIVQRWKAWFAKKEDAQQVQALARRVSPHADLKKLMEILSGDDGRERTTLEKRLAIWAGRGIARAEAQLFEEIARKIHAAKTVVENSTGLLEASHRFENLNKELENKTTNATNAQGLAELRHALEMATTKRAIENLGVESPLQQQLAQKRVEAEIAELEAKINGLKNQQASPSSTPWWQRFAGSMDRDVQRMRRDQVRADVLEKYIRQKFEAEIGLARDNGDVTAAEDLEHERDRILGDLSTGELET